MNKKWGIELQISGNQLKFSITMQDYLFGNNNQYRAWFGKTIWMM